MSRTLRMRHTERSQGSNNFMSTMSISCVYHQGQIISALGIGYYNVLLNLQYAIQPLH